jgi:hypothetical protein
MFIHMYSTCTYTIKNYVFTTQESYVTCSNYCISLYDINIIEKKPQFVLDNDLFIYLFIYLLGLTIFFYIKKTEQFDLKYYGNVWNMEHIKHIIKNFNKILIELTGLYK